MKGLKRLMALVLTACMVVALPTFVSAADPLVAQSAYQLSPTTLRLNFSQPVGNNGAHFVALRIVDSATSQNLQWLDGTPMQWSGGWAYESGATPWPTGCTSSVWDWTISESRTIDEVVVDTIDGVYALTKPGGRFEGCTVMFCIEENSGGANVAENGYVDSMWVSGSETIKLTATRSTGPDAIYMELLQELTLDRVIPVGSDKLQLHFSEPVHNNGQHFMSIRILDNMTTQNLVEDDTDGHLQWSFTVVEPFALGYPTYLWELSMTGTKTIAGVGTVDTIEGILALVAPGGKYEGKAVAFGIEENGGGAGTIGASGYVDTFWDAVDGDGQTRKLKATRPADHQLDRVYVPLTKDELTLDSAYIYGQTAILNFSVPFSNNGAHFIALRVVDKNNRLRWDNAVDNEEANGGTPYQLTINIQVYYGATDTKLIGLLESVAGYEWLKAAADSNPDWELKVCIEELFPEGNANNGRVNSIWSHATGVGLWANKPGGWDGAYAPVYELEQDFTIDDITVISGTELQVTFENAVTFTDEIEQINPFFAPALTDAAGNIKVHFDPYYSHYYWPGTWAATSDPKVFNFTMTSDAFGFTSLYDIAATTLEGGANEGHTLTLNGFPLDMGDLDEVKLLKAEAVSDRQILLTFSEPISIIGSPFIAIRMTDPARNNELAWSEGGWGNGSPLQWAGSWVWNNEEHSQILWTITDTSFAVGNVSDILAYKGLEGFTGYDMRFAIEDGGEMVRGMNGLIDSIVGLESGRKLSNNFQLAERGDGVYIPITKAYDDRQVTVSKVEQLNEIQLKITFSEAVVFTGGTFNAIRLVDNNNALVWTGEQDASTPLQWYGTLTPVAGSETEFIWTIGGNNTMGISNLTDLLAYKGLDDYASYAMKFCMEELSADAEAVFNPSNRLVDNIAAKDGLNWLNANGRYAVGYSDGFYAPITKLQSDTTPVTVTGAALLNNTQIVVTFSEPVEFIGDPFMALRMLKSDGTLVWDGEEEASTPMQWGGYWAWYNDAHTQIVWTLSGAQPTYGAVTIGDVLNFAGDLAAFKSSGYSIKFVIEENNVADLISVIGNNGLVENIKAAARNKAVSGTFGKDNYFDAVQMTVTGTVPADKLTLVEAKAISDREIVLTFSGAVTITGSPFMAVRLVGENNTLIWDGEVEASTPMQWGGSWEYHNTERTQIKWTLTDVTYGIGNLYDLFNKNGIPEELKEYDLMFCIEEFPPEMLLDNRHIDNIVMRANSMVALSANRPAVWDGNYIEISVPYSIAPVTSSATIINENQVRIDFSAPVNINGTPFMALRLTRNNQLAWTGIAEQSTPLQFYGSWEYADETKSAIIWTMNGGNQFGTNNIRDIFEYRGALAGFTDCKLVMCIEEAGEIVPYNNLVENVVSTNGRSRLYANFSMGADHSYMPMKSNLSDSALTVVSAKAIDDMTIEVTFSGPVRFAEGAMAPSIGIRYLSDSGATEVGNDGRFMVFRGNWTWKDDSQTVLVWKLDTANARGDAKNLSDIFNFEGELRQFDGCTIAFCIQDPSDDDSAAFKWDMRVNGVSSPDGTSFLTATRKGEFGQAQIEIEIGYTLPEKSVTIGTDSVTEPNIITNYLWVYIVSGVVLVCGIVFGIVAGKRKKSNA